MEIYLSLWLFICMCSLIPYRFNPRSKKILISFFCVFLVFFIGFRHEVGADWESYEEIGLRIKDLSLWQAIQVTDPAYALLNWLFYRPSSGIYFVNLICAFLFVFGLALFIYRQPNVALSFIIAISYLITAVAMGYTRQSVAIGFILLSFTALMDRNIGRFIMYTVFASLFHKTAVIIFLLLPVAEDRLRAKHIILMAMICLPIAIFFLKDSFADLWDLYTSKKMESGGAFLRMGLNLLPAGIFGFYRKKWKSMYSESYRLTLYLSVAALCFLPLTIFASTLADRFSLYILPLQILVYSRLPFLVSTTWRRASIIFILFLYFTVYLVWLNYSTHVDSWIPYQFKMLI